MADKKIIINGMVYKPNGVQTKNNISTEFYKSELDGSIVYRNSHDGLFYDGVTNKILDFQPTKEPAVQDVKEVPTTSQYPGGPAVFVGQKTVNGKTEKYYRLEYGTGTVSDLVSESTIQERLAKYKKQDKKYELEKEREHELKKILLEKGTNKVKDRMKMKQIINHATIQQMMEHD